MNKLWIKFGFIIAWPILCSLLLVIERNVMMRLSITMLITYGYIISNLMPTCIPMLVLLFLLPVLHLEDSGNISREIFSYACVTLSTMFNASSLQHSGLHERFTLWLILKFGCSPRKVTCALMIVSHFISMWLSNVNAINIMMPVALKIYETSTIILESSTDRKLTYLQLTGIPTTRMVQPSTIGTAYAFAIIFGAACGGLTFAKGSPTNISFLLIYKIRLGCIFSTYVWFTFTAPVTLIISLVGCLWIQVVYLGLFNIKWFRSYFDKNMYNTALKRNRPIEALYKKMGPITWQQLCIGMVLVLCVLLWMFRYPAHASGWQTLLTDHNINYSSITFFVTFLLVIIPVDVSCLRRCRRQTGFNCGLVTWRVLQKDVNWNDFLLCGGLNILAVLQSKCGLAKYFAEKLTFMKHWPLPVVILVVTFVVLWGTELLLNTMICSIVTPILIELAIFLDFHPMSLSFIGCLVCSMAFICPLGSRTLKTVLSFMNYEYKRIIMANLIPKMLAYFITYVMYLTFGKLFFGKELQRNWVYSTDVCYCTPCEKDDVSKDIIYPTM